MNEMVEILLGNVQLAVPFLIVGFLNGILGAIFFYLSLFDNDPPGFIQTVIQLVLVFLPVLVLQEAYSEFFFDMVYTVDNRLWIAPGVIGLIFVPFYLGDLLANVFEGGIKKRAVESFRETMHELGL